MNKYKEGRQQSGVFLCTGITVQKCQIFIYLFE